MARNSFYRTKAQIAYLTSKTSKPEQLQIHMADNKKSFILYCDLISTVSKLPDDVAGKLFKFILEYVNDLNPVTEDLLLQIAFEPVKNHLKRDLKCWEGTKVVRTISGHLGGIKSGESRRKKQTKQVLQKRSKPKQTEANEAVTVNVTVNDTVTEERGKGISAPDLSKSNLFREPVIPNKHEVLECFVQNGGSKEMAKSFYERNQSTGWYFKGSPIINFRNQVASFVANWHKNEKNNSHYEPVGINKAAEAKARAIINGTWQVR